MSGPASRLAGPCRCSPGRCAARVAGMTVLDARVCVCGVRLRLAACRLADARRGVSMRTDDDKSLSQQLFVRCARSPHPYLPLACVRHPRLRPVFLQTGSERCERSSLPLQNAFKDNEKLIKENRQLEAGNTELRARGEAPPCPARPAPPCLSLPHTFSARSCTLPRSLAPHAGSRRHGPACASLRADGSPPYVRRLLPLLQNELEALKLELIDASEAIVKMDDASRDWRQNEASTKVRARSRLQPRRTCPPLRGTRNGPLAHIPCGSLLGSRPNLPQFNLDELESGKRALIKNLEQLEARAPGTRSPCCPPA